MSGPQWARRALAEVLDRVAVTAAEAGERFPLYADPHTGRWTTTGRGAWAGGFWAGLLWLRARHTGAPADLAAARACTARLAGWADADTSTRGLILWYATAPAAGDAGARELRDRAAEACRAAFDTELGLVPWGSAFGGPRLLARVDGVPGMVPLLAAAGPAGADAAASHLARHLTLCLHPPTPEAHPPRPAPTPAPAATGPAAPSPTPLRGAAPAPVPGRVPVPEPGPAPARVPVPTSLPFPVPAPARVPVPVAVLAPAPVQDPVLAPSPAPAVAPAPDPVRHTDPGRGGPDREDGRCRAPGPALVPAWSFEAGAGWRACEDPPTGWSRGRAWLLLAVADVLHRPAIAERLPDGTREIAERLAAAWAGPGADLVPPADAARPDGPVDTSAAAVTAVALLKLARLPGPRSTDHAYRAAEILERLVDGHLSGGRLLDGCYDAGKAVAVRHELVWGDFFLALGLAELTALIDIRDV
ncbi:sugar ABC transporter permease [Streptomyces sp. NPDC054961]